MVDRPDWGQLAKPIDLQLAMLGERPSDIQPGALQQALQSINLFGQRGIIPRVSTLGGSIDLPWGFNATGQYNAGSGGPPNFKAMIGYGKSF